MADAPETAAQTHAVLRARAGFDINQLVAEYRALRASVLRMWIDDGALDATGIDDIVRFNEAIDQAIAESVAHFHVQVEQSRNLLLGMLGHDLRSPLNTIVATASYLSALNAGEQVSTAAQRLIRSGQSMRALLDDLVDFNRAHLGLGIRIASSPIDLGTVVAEEIDLLRAAHPNCRIELTLSGNCRGHWDGTRLQQALRNLVGNAVKHGAPDAPIEVALAGDAADVCLAVSNRGPAIDPEALDALFDPLRQGIGEADRLDPASLGLGLFIVRQIVRGHGGEVQARCDGGRTTFTVRLPRGGAAPAG